MRETIRETMILGQRVVVEGFFDSDTPEGEFEGFDLFVGETCINLGSCFYEPPTDEQIKPFVEDHLG